MADQSRDCGETLSYCRFRRENTCVSQYMRVYHTGLLRIVFTFGVATSIAQIDIL